jgi:nucleoside-triphosphatase THEP1
MTAPHPEVIIVFSPPHTGKSSLLFRYTEMCSKRNIRMAGILAEGLWEKNVRSGFNLVDLSNGVRVPLAFRCAPGEKRRGIIFDFHPEGAEAAREALDEKRCAGAELIVVDEVGKLELKGCGWAPYLGPLLQLTGKKHVWAVRDTLVKAVAERWGFTPHAVVDARSPDALQELINACALF